MGAYQSQPVEESSGSPKLSSSPSSKPAPSEGRKKLQISQGIVPPTDQQKFDRLISETEFSEAQIQKIMKEFGSHNYQYGLNKEKFADIMENLGLFAHAHHEGFGKEQLRDVFFNMFDANHDGEISFFEFVSGCSVLLKGDLDTKARMFFRMYDKSGDGKITRMEMFEIVKQFLNSTLKYKRAQYRNMAKFIGEDELNQHYEDIVEEEVSDDTVTKIVDSAFDQADTDADNIIGLEEFVQWAKTSKAVRNQMSKLGFRFGEKK